MATVGRYQIIRQLGQGGMGTVLLAHDPSLERDIALKLVHRDVMQGGLRDEAKVLAAISHPNIVTVFEIGEHDGQDYIAMEYLPGRSLRDVLRAGAMTRDERISVCAKVATALVAAHHRGILHRDIKPENVVVTATGDVKVVDFGVARRVGSRQHARPVSAQDVVELLSTIETQEVTANTETVFGTPAYMAPEVLIGGNTSEASDIYSLGVMVYECISGRRPYDTTRLYEMIAQVIGGTSVARLDDPLGELIERMLAHDPAARPRLNEIVLELGDLDPVPTMIDVPDRKRRRWPIAAGAVVAVALGIGAWQVATHGQDAAPPAPPPPPPPVELPQVVVAVAPIQIDAPVEQFRLRSEPMTDLLRGLLEDATGAHVRAIAAESPEAARAAGATFLVTGTTTSDGSVVVVKFDVVAVADGKRIASATVSRRGDTTAELMRALAAKVAESVAPSAKIQPRSATLAAGLVAHGNEHLEKGQFIEAQPYFELAIGEDPISFDAWYGLAFVLDWVDPTSPQMIEAIDRAHDLAPTTIKKKLVEGVALQLRNEYTKARLALEPLEHATDLTAADRKQVLYYLGEANWHDGRFDAGFAYLKSVLETVDHDYTPARVHLAEYVLARRDRESARFYLGLASVDPIEFSAGNYQALADAGKPPYGVFALMVLGRPVARELQAKLYGNDLDAFAFDVGQAIDHDDLAGARARFAELGPRVEGMTDFRNEQLAALEALAEVVIAAELAPESREIVEVLARSGHPHKITLQRLTILAAGVAHDASLLPAEPATERLRSLADGIRAELAGHPDAAAAILGKLVASPSTDWDYGERAALIRELRAAKRRKDVAALCADTMRPALFRPAFLVLHHTCAKR